MEHIPVMPDEVLQHLNVKKGGTYIDCTFGGGGHSKRILDALAGSGRLVAIDWDPETIESSEKIFSNCSNFTVACGNYSELKNIAANLKIERIDGILFDFGFSSKQIDDARRGFSFLYDAPLDMRYSRNNPLTAAMLINTYPQDYIEDILFKFAQEQFSRRIAAEIIRNRSIKKIETTKELAEIIEKAVPGWYRHRRIHPATKTFQAVRMAVNDEIKNVETGLRAAIDLVSPGGRVLAISFHSGEHRCVRNIFREAKQNNIAALAVKKSVLPSDDETNANPRSRSAQLRVLEKK